jgi:hypothetical protein
VLARHDNDFDLRCISFGCVVGAWHELKRLHLAFSLEMAIGCFLDSVQKELKELASSPPTSDAWLTRLQFFPSILRVGNKTTLSDADRGEH